MSSDARPRLLIVNTGSSSVKLTVRAGDRTLHALKVAPDDDIDLATFVAPYRPIDAVIHRVVHAGDVRRHTHITHDVQQAIENASSLAPLHNPMALRYIARSRVAFGSSMPQLAAVDTAFFAKMPAHAAHYALPPDIGAAPRYGFHGLAHAFMARRVAELDARAPHRIVTLQLGAGCSATAVRDGCALDTSMGFSPSEGLVMARRSGDVDPGLLIHLVRTRGYTADDLDRVVNARGGLLGLCGDDDMAKVVQRAEANDARAALALDLYCYRVRKVIGAFAGVLGGLDALVFGGGVGENAPEVRRRIVGQLGWLGVELDPARNAGRPTDEAITTSVSWVTAWVLAVDEAAEMTVIAGELLRESVRDSLHHGVEHAAWSPK